MFEKLSLTKMAHALASHAGTRLSVIANNTANADTPNFRAKDVVDFYKFYKNEVSFTSRSTRPEHLNYAEEDTAPLVETGDSMSPNGNDVSLDMQMMKAVEARQSHELALSVYRGASSVIRTSLSRN